MSTALQIIGIIVFLVFASLFIWEFSLIPIRNLNKQDKAVAFVLCFIGIVISGFGLGYLVGSLIT